jgi:hypothetical protein
MSDCKRITHLKEPTRLLLAWNMTGKTRRVVGVINKLENGVVTLKYSQETEDFEAAIREGFERIPAFRSLGLEHTSGVMDYFMSRITSRKREDFGDYLNSIGISEKNKDMISDFALLGYGEGRLPSDGYHVVNDYSDVDLPIEFVSELSGVQFCDYAETTKDLIVGQPLDVIPEPNNEYDCNAIAVYNKDRKLGYINRIQAKTVCNWIESGAKVTGSLHRKNGLPTAQRLFLFIQAQVP